jgi:hypothetical protein
MLDMNKSAMSLALLLAITPLTASANMAAQYSQTSGEERVVNALRDALDVANFQQCRFEITGSFLRMVHGDWSASLDLLGPGSMRSTDGKSLSVIGPTYEFCDDGSYRDYYKFMLSEDQRRITQVLYVRNQVKQINTGTILAPHFENVESTVMKFSCEAELGR